MATAIRLGKFSAHGDTRGRRDEAQPLGDLLLSHQDALTAYLTRRLLPRADLVSDFAQSTFASAWEHLPSYRGEASVRNWILGIARHKVQDHYRRSAVRESQPLDKDSNAPELQHHPCLEERIDSAKQAIRVRAVLADLPDIYQCVLRSHYWDRLTLLEIGTRLGRSEKAVERLLARARQRFKKGWVRHGRVGGHLKRHM